MEERLQKFMARCGVASRRKCEELIADGLVELNGEVVREPGVKIDPKRDRVRVDGKFVRAETAAYYAHYKVKGITTTVSDDLGRRTIMDCLPDIRERVYPVGRLDKDSEGLILLTNDGELANYVTHPAHGIGKTYRAVAEGRIPKETLDALAEKGMRLGPVLIRPTRVQLVRYDNENTIVLISVAEGINREVRRIFAALGHEVKKLLRTQIGPVELEGMKRGTTRALTPREIAQLRKGMEGMDAGAEEKQYPRGSAVARKPTGPRGRTRAGSHTGARGDSRPGARKERAPRQGKPDPALAKPRGKSDVTVDDWKKKTGPRRPAGAAVASGASTASAGRGAFAGRGTSAGRSAPAGRASSAGRGAGASAERRAPAGRDGRGGKGGRDERASSSSSFEKKPLRTLRPERKARKPSFSSFVADDAAPKPAARGKAKAPFERKPRAVRHPLAAPKAKERPTGGQDRAERSGRPDRPERFNRPERPERAAKPARGASASSGKPRGGAPRSFAPRSSSSRSSAPRSFGKGKK